MHTYRIYGLYVRDDDGSKQYFYVGRTRRSIAARVAEHRNRARNEPQDVYVHLRRLKAQGIEWDSEELYRCATSEYQSDAEYLYVILLLRAGHDLRNMRYGDQRRQAFLQRAAGNPAIRTIADVKRARLNDATIRARDQANAHGRLRRKEFEAVLKTRGVAGIGNCPLFPKVLRRRLAGQGVDSIGRGLDLPGLVRLARNMAGWRTLQDLAREVNARHPLPKPDGAA